MRLIDKRPKVSRRDMLKTGGAVAAAASVLPAAIVSHSALAAEPVAISPDSFATLVKMARDIYPHDQIADKYYASVVADLDKAAKDDAQLKTLLEDGVTALNKKATGLKYGAYANVPSEEERVAILTEMEATPFFQKLRGSLVTGLYNNKELWPHFGYEGSSADKGGYINRGFGDIDWL
ncbi:gluconate 2-dehydrogenase subunit 3 family protein [Nordella sp. HKS 07]|uniref:twin-arginine translocation signal domain-containing protein n=1 Tax=Nordella sp. HKS 07 TaxID=2712222 RepID=UPI0013E2015C|nr:twin-arginine translocation signal domain-containing protein [Nordella sp. HKS 07]QIG47154.1 gluconate 2-dehydrogenase subunit 3 family protein [Nordella sp. HKS 07]